MGRAEGGEGEAETGESFALTGRIFFEIFTDFLTSCSGCNGRGKETKKMKEKEKGEV